MGESDAPKAEKASISLKTSLHPGEILEAAEECPVTTKPCLTTQAQRRKDSRRRPEILSVSVCLCVSVVGSYNSNKNTAARVVTEHRKIAQSH